MATITTTGRATVGEMTIVTTKDDEYGRVMVCADAWIDTFSDDGPEAMATWREATDAERMSPEYAALAERIESKRQQHAVWAANVAAGRDEEMRGRAARTPEQHAAIQAERDALPRRADTDDLSVITQEDEDLLDELFS